MTIYEVNLKIPLNIYDHYQDWLRSHIKQMLSFKGFKKACFYQEDLLDDAFIYLTIHYYLDQRSSLEHYFTHHADQMRAEGLTLFPDVSANRRILIALPSSEDLMLAH